MKNAFYLLAVSLLLLAATTASAQSDNVGIGTLSPNRNAILDLTSNSKGLMVPRLDSTHRNAIPVGPGEASLLVYDMSDSLFHYWNGVRWKYFPAKPGDSGWIISGNDEHSVVSGNVGIGVPTPTAKLHTQGTVRFSLLGTTTTNTNVLTVDASGNVQTRTLGIDIWDGDDDGVNDLDKSPSNECNSSMFYNTGTQELTIIDGCGPKTTVIPTDPNDFDKDSTNELQSLSSSTLSNIVTIGITGGTGAQFDNNDLDANPSNELQTLTISKSGKIVTWNLSNGGGGSTFDVDDQDWAGAGSGSMYPYTITDKVGIGTATPAHRLDVLGDSRVSGKQYFTTTDYYIQNSGTDLLLFSQNNMKLQTGNDHVITFYESGSEAIANFNLDGQDAVTMRGNGTYDYGVGIGTTTPANKLQVAGSVRVGLINAPGFTNGGDNYGDQLYFSGGPGYAGGFDSDNDDLIFMARYNDGADVSELRIGVGDDHNSSGNNLDRLSIGSVSPGGGLSTFTGLFDFEIENPGSSNGPMLSIAPNGFVHAKTYHGGLSISKPSGSNGQYINLARTDVNSVNSVWSIGYQFGTNRFAIHEGNTNDAAFAVTPFFTIMPTTGYVGLGVASPSYRIELPNDNSTNGQGRAQSWVTYSDGRFKKNREGIGSVIPKIMQLNPVYYQWEKYGHDSRGKISATGELSDKREMGFIAQDVYKIFPEVVQRPADESTDSWSMDYARLTVVLTKAVQEQQKLLDAEKDAHQQTKAELQDLKDEVEQMRLDMNRMNMMLGKGMSTNTTSKKPQ